MSEDTNTPTPENIIPITAEAPSSPQPEEDPVQQAIAGVDLSTISKDDVFVDIINQSKLFAFRLMVGAALLEQLIIKGQAEAVPADVQNTES